MILTNEPDRQRWEEMGFFASHGASNPGVVANIAAFRHGEAWLDDILGYLDEGRHLLADLLRRHLPQVRYRPPDGTYLAWLDCTAMDLPGSPGTLVTDRARITVVDGPAFGAGGAGSFRLNFATPHPILANLVERIAAALTWTHATRVIAPAGYLPVRPEPRGLPAYRSPEPRCRLGGRPRSRPRPDGAGVPAGTARPGSRTPRRGTVPPQNPRSRRSG